MNFKKRVKEKYDLLVDKREFQQDIRSIGYDIKQQSIVAMAFSRKEAMEKLKALNLKISEHLLKILVMPNSRSVNHWQAELKAWQKTLRQHNKGKSPSGRNYSRKDLLHWIWECPFGLPSDRTFQLELLREEGYAVSKTVDEKKLKKAVVEFIDGVLVKK